MNSLRATLITGSLALAAAIVLLLGLGLDREVETLVRSEVVEMLLREEILMRSTLESGMMSSRRTAEVASSLGMRLTLIDSTGRVVFDTDVDSSRLPSLDNHLTRPEIQEALQTGTGSSMRHGASTSIDQVYAARYAPFTAKIDGRSLPAAFIRLSFSLTKADARVASVRVRIIFAALLILLLVAIAAALVARRIIKPIIAMSRTARAIGDGDLSRRVDVHSRGEIGDLGNAINTMVQKLEFDIRELERLGRYRSEFLGDVSHELRTPIFAIQGSVETVMGDDSMSSDVRRSFLDTAMRNTARLSALVSDLIDISRIESRELRLSLRYFDVIPFIHDIADEFRPSASRKGLALTVSASEQEVSVYGDRDRLLQVIVNLVDNAVKNTERGSVDIRVTLEQGKARIAVTDTGIGIPAKHLPRIFERFYRVDKDRSRASGGTGLGLAIAKHIIEAHNGKLFVESVIDQGSTFWFELPT